MPQQDEMPDDTLADREVSWFVLAATAPRDRIDPATLAGAAGRVDPDALAPWALHHGVWHWVDLAFHQSRAWGSAPAPTARWQNQCRRQAMRGLRAVAELGRVNGAFATSGIPLMALKGPALATDLHGDPVARDPGDLDLLVRAEDLPAADRLLQSLGWRREGPPDLDRAATFHTVLVRAACDLAYRHGEHGLRLELHWRWHRNPHALPFDADHVWGSDRTVTLSRQDVRVPDLPVLWLYLASHGGRHGWARLKWITDIRQALAIPAFRDALPEALRLGRASGTARPLEMALHLARRLDAMVGVETTLALPEPSDRRAEALAGRVAETLCPGGRLRFPKLDKWAEMAAEWHLVPDLRRRLSGLIHRTVLPAEYDASTLPLPRPLHALYPLLRPALWLRRRW